MSKSRLEAFSDGVIAILITIMVLELRAPAGSDLAALAEVLPTVGLYVLSFAFLGIFWNNHHLNGWIAVALFALVALMWLVPDRRIEGRVSAPAATPSTE
jgi:uncharacterized membrane protein